VSETAGKHDETIKMMHSVSMRGQLFFNKLFREAIQLDRPFLDGETSDENLLRRADEVLNSSWPQRAIRISREVNPQNPEATDQDLEHYHEYILYLASEVEKYGMREVFGY
jgi:hypothetical protein